MPFGRITVSIALASLLAGTAAAQQPFDQKKYPDIAGQWQRVGIQFGFIDGIDGGWWRQPESGGERQPAESSNTAKNILR